MTPVRIIAPARVDKGERLIRHRGRGYVFHAVTEPVVRPVFKDAAA